MGVCKSPSNSYYRQLTPILIGLCLGIALSLIMTPFLDDECLGRSVANQNGRAERSNKGDDEYTPVIIAPKEIVGPGKSNIKVNRPRYVSTELGIKDKVFVAVLTSRDTIETLGVAINKTLTHHVNKVVFFMESTQQPNLKTPMTVVGFSDDRPLLKPFHMFRYIGDHYLNDYDYFYVLTDTTYVRGERLVDFLNHVSISHDLYMGKRTDENSVYCSLAAGIVFGSSVMKQIVNELDWCTRNAFSPDHDDNIGRCVLHTSNSPCTQNIKEKYYLAFDLGTEYKAADVNSYITSTLSRKETFTGALAVYPVTSADTVYRLHIYFCRLDLSYTKKVIGDIKRDIVNMSYLTPRGRSSAPWPVGIQEPFDAKARFDILRYDYFTETHIYLDNDYNTVKELQGAHALDVRDILDRARREVTARWPHYQYRHLVNGYRRFDPTRGMEYTVDLAFYNKREDKEVHKRAHLVRPLSHVEIIPMPYVTENTVVTLILPVREEDKDGVVTFLDNYAQTCMETQDNTVLMLIFIYDQSTSPQGPPAEESKEADPFYVVKSMISYYENKYKGVKIAMVSVQSHQPSIFHIVDVASKRFMADQLFLLCTVGMDISAEFLNRVRMNTLQGWQVFFPIPFYQYKPNIVYKEKPWPSAIEINKNFGHFDAASYDHAAFYNSDYVSARLPIAGDVPVVDSAAQIPVSGVHAHTRHDLYGVFLATKKLHVFRAVEPALKHRFRMVHCSPTANEEEYKDCLISKQEGLASRSQLAMLIFEHQMKTSQSLVLQENVHPKANAQLKGSDK